MTHLSTTSMINYHSCPFPIHTCLHFHSASCTLYPIQRPINAINRNVCLTSSLQWYIIFDIYAKRARVKCQSCRRENCAFTSSVNRRTHSRSRVNREVRQRKVASISKFFRMENVCAIIFAFDINLPRFERKRKMRQNQCSRSRHNTNTSVFVFALVCIAPEPVCIQRMQMNVSMTHSFAFCARRVLQQQQDIVYFR